MFPYSSRSSAMDHRWKPTVEVAPNCPRCASVNTKFCYYNNYSLSQPRYFCKGCRRYWTKGGSLRNVPVGGGCRKTRRVKSSKLPPTKAVSISLGFSGDGPSSVANPTVVPTTAVTDASNIDLAVVLAKFLNQNSSLGSGLITPEFSSEKEVNASLNISTSSNSNELAEDSNVVDWQSQTDLAIDAHLIKEPPQLFPGQLEFDCKQQQERISQFAVQKSNSNSGFQPLVSDGTAQDAFWWEAPAVPNLAWQPEEFQSLETIPFNDHITMFYPHSPNDNWSSFDTLNYESFSRP
ncbi:PREDICTED: dof zinc finger protein DOF1.2 [Nelumbo nucifera]|uniref:Dof zinc finger protein n=2 Tax=Nelumbo nucifera TaxID=4432 RepID=A0A822Z9C3_NELNU|nr:PREDICTED: dof zinc finger protein DOF1.2 [Nelumbo nucifera]DAD39979.1 TPA_asm: hypothetical protein HUJ06_014302 [Nelumbo nucifera]